MDALPALRGQIMLIVEDIPDVGIPLSTIVRRRAGAVAEVFASIAQTKTRLGRDPRPALLLIDHTLYDGIGTTLAIWIRQQPALQYVVLVSYSAQPPMVIQATGPELDAMMRAHAAARPMEMPR